MSWARRGRARRTRSTPRVRGRRQRDPRIGGELVEHASRAGAKVVLVGDHRRLPEIDAGGTFRGLAVRTEPIVLTENRRQREEWARRMVDLIRRGEVRDGLELAAEQGSVVVTPTSEAAQAQLVRDWWEATRDGREAIMIAHRRAEVSALNEAAHALMDDAARLGADRLELAGGEFAVGDHVHLKRSSKALGLDIDFHGGERSTTDAFDAFVRQVERSHAHAAALDVATRHDVAALSGAQLEAERHRLQRIIRQAPGPRLRRELASAEANLAEANRTAAAATRWRIQSEPARDGDPQATIDLVRARSIERDALLALGHAMEHVHKLRMELAADRWAVDHADDLARYATVRNELATRGRLNVLCHRHTDIPEYLTADLGDRPTPRAPRPRRLRPSVPRHRDGEEAARA